MLIKKSFVLLSQSLIIFSLISSNSKFKLQLISIIMITYLYDCIMKSLNITYKWTIDKSGFLNSNQY